MEGLPCVSRDVFFLMFDIVVLFDLVCRRFCEKLGVEDRIRTFESFPSVARVSFSTFKKMWSLFLDVWSVRMEVQG